MFHFSSCSPLPPNYFNSPLPPHLLQVSNGWNCELASTQILVSSLNFSSQLYRMSVRHSSSAPWAPHISLNQWKKKFAWIQLLQKCRNVTIVDLIESESVNSLTASLPEYQMKRTSVKLRSIMTTAMIKHPRSQNKVCICSSEAKRAPFLPESMIEIQSSLEVPFSSCTFLQFREW